MDGIAGVNGLKIQNTLQSTRAKVNRQDSSEDLNKFNSELKKATGEFEEFFLHQMMKEMRKTVPKDGLIAKKHGEEIFNDMLDQKYAGLLSKKGGFGLSDFLFDQLKKK